MHAEIFLDKISFITPLPSFRRFLIFYGVSEMTLQIKVIVTKPPDLEFDPHGGRREPNLTSHPLATTTMPWHVFCLPDKYMRLIKKLTLSFELRPLCIVGK